MRIDQLLKTLCLIKTRTMAKKACDSGLVFLNGIEAKASVKVNSGDIIEFTVWGSTVKVKITAIPQKNISKTNAVNYYESLFTGPDPTK
ncbi:MAG: RNA-binding S4 domain-containing protein [Candidatus Cloacimonetes bacterium]|nr:RNA-binding S4 domain-containing protein [Candidatus Cloacimonadota bacterium]